MKLNEELWNEFSKGKLVVNCKTKQEANKFLIYLHNKGIKWCWNLRLIEKSYFNDYKENTCYRITSDGNLEYSNLDFYKNFSEYKRITFKNLLQNQYSTWEIIKMYQEINLNKNDIVIGRDFRKKVSSLREENLGVDDLLINEPFTIQRDNLKLKNLVEDLEILIEKYKTI
ncbi:hypothetical protein [Clostridium sp. CTA-6]